MIDDMLRELEAVGTVESEGEFTLDRAKAREKMRRFQLADPRAYVLELVQAAALKGATSVRFAIDSRDMVMELDGDPFTTEDFDDIYGAALSRRLDPEVLARRQLALGLNSAMALRPVRIVVESGDGKTGAQLRLEPDEEDELSAIETTVVGTRIHVRERFGLGTFVSFFKDLRGTLAEEQLLRARCGYAAFAIDLEGTRLDGGLRLDPDPVLDVIMQSTGHTQLVCGLHPEGEGASYVRLVKDGVWITDHPLPGKRFPLGFRAVVQDHALRKDVSQGDIVQDDAYDTMLTVVQAGAFRAVAALAARYQAGNAPAWAETELLRELGRLDASSVHAVDEPTGRVRALRQLALWETTDGRRLSLEQILAEADANGNVGHTSRSRFEGVLLPERSFVLYLVGVDSVADRRKDVLRRIVGPCLVDVTDMLVRVYQREKARRAWRSRSAEPRLPAGAYLVRRLVEGPGVRGEVGITAQATERARVGLVADGCMVADKPVELPWLGLRVVVEADAFEPSESYLDITRDAATFRALLSVAEVIPALYGDLAQLPASAWRDACAHSMLESLLRVDAVGPAFALPICEVADALAAAEVKAFGAERLRAELEPLGDAPHPVATMPLFATLGARRYSLAQLCQRARKDEPIEVVEQAEPGLAADIVVLDDEDRELLQPLFVRPFVDATKKVRALVRERDFLRRPTGVPTLDTRAPAVLVPIEGEGITGMLRVDPSADSTARSQPITVLHRQRVISGLPLLLVGTCTGWVEPTTVQPRSDYRGVKSSPALDDARAAVLRAFATACRLVAERAATHRDTRELAFLREVAGLVFPSRGLRAVYDKLERSKSVSRAKAVEAYQRLYAAMHVGKDAAELEQRMWRASRSRTTIADALAIESPKRGASWALTAVDLLFPSKDPAEPPGDRVMRPVAALAELPLFGRHDRRTLTIAELASHKGTVLHVDDFAEIDMGERMVVRAEAEEVEILRRLLGTSRLLKGDGVVKRERQRQVLQAKPKVDQIALRPGQALVSVRWQESKSRKTSEGEVGLSSDHPGDPSRMPRLALRVHRERVEIEEVRLPDQPAELVASANDDRLTLGIDLKSIHRNKRFETLVGRCQEQAPELVAMLVAGWATLGSATRKTAWYHVLDYLRANRPDDLQGWDDASVVGKRYAKAASLPGFLAVGGGRWSAAQLAQLHVRREMIEVLPAPGTAWGESPLPPDRPVICIDAYELSVLRGIFPTVEYVQSSWHAWQTRARKLRAAPVASTLADVPALVSHSLQAPGIKGWLAIPAAGGWPMIELCAEGRVATTQKVEGVLSCTGSVSGRLVVPNDLFSDATLGPVAVTALQVASVELYRALGRWFSANPEHAEHGRVASRLSDAVVQLAKQGKSLELTGQVLLAELRELPVLALRNGRRISLQTAQQERPDELGHLDLWPARSHRLQQMFEASLEGVPAARPEPARATLPPPPPPPPPPKPREPTPEERLVEAVRAELRLVRQSNRSLLSELHLDRIRVEALPRKHRSLAALAGTTGVIVNREHPVVERALALHTVDPAWVSFVSSAVYTALNVWLEEITDADEQRFLVLLATLVVSG